MKRHLAMKQNRKIVEQHDEVLSAIADVLAAEWAGPAEALRAYGELSRRMDELGVAVEGPDWAVRLEIGKKGGGCHFSADELALAGRAYARTSALCDFAGRARQLQGRTLQLRALHAALDANAELPREKRIERLHAALHAGLRVYREVLLGSTAQADERRSAQARIPGSLQADGDELLAALPAASHGAFLVAQDELASWRREPVASRRFRACRALIIVQQALAVLVDVHLQLEHLERRVPEEVGTERAELEARCAELQAEVAAIPAEDADADGVV
ncbi:hypothetical protein T492DRAFT_993014 [Pavlovales sp. CCMP2436]|nr:hypothetical protein T492DRAFT_993014 [Pavlovales sp. CCMP2436]